IMSLLNEVTPVVITWNEEPNIKRVFDQLVWARDVVVVDSGSSDGTLALLAGYPNVRVFENAFRSHADQWNFALRETSITTDWVLSIDADYVLSDTLACQSGAVRDSRGSAPPQCAFSEARLGRPHPADSLRRSCPRGSLLPADQGMHPGWARRPALHVPARRRRVPACHADLGNADARRLSRAASRLF